ncbi:MAG: sigma-70 family RNA polymerase sigma factor [Verrucomicrobiota bacterium]|nr:sigma-70 family RNA polymerase sigma factor [Verrucomicrobiota bacterium]MDI9385855.1 sigma-70 family RNA polymerase sigma factor [Verrucomicrobiota bacterium]
MVSPIPSDRDLFRRVQQGDAGAFEEFFDRYSSSILNYVYRMIGDWQAAEDIAQETFIRAFRHVGSFRFESEPKTWLYRIATNLLRNAVRKRNKRSEYQVRLFPMDEEESANRLLEGVDESQRPDRQAMGREFERILQEAIASLPERLRVVVVMCDIQNHSYEEAAVLLGISYDAIRQRHSRARARLDPLVKRFVRDIGHESESDVS